MLTTWMTVVNGVVAVHVTKFNAGHGPVFPKVMTDTNVVSASIRVLVTSRIAGAIARQQIELA